MCHDLRGFGLWATSSLISDVDAASVAVPEVGVDKRQKTRTVSQGWCKNSAGYWAALG